MGDLKRRYSEKTLNITFYLQINITLKEVQQIPPYNPKKNYIEMFNQRGGGVTPSIWIFLI